MSKRIRDRFVVTGPKLNEASKQAIADLNAKYPHVPFKKVLKRRYMNSEKY